MDKMSDLKTDADKTALIQERRDQTKIVTDVGIFPWYSFRIQILFGLLVCADMQTMDGRHRSGSNG